jgi:dTDP-4-amino-4,6-dideoxygalactose transaminase
MPLNLFIPNISARPHIKIKDFFIKQNEDEQYNHLFFQNGSNALVYGLKKLELKKGSKILIPAYICKSIENAIKSNGYDVIFQDINDDLDFDLDELKFNISKYDIKAVLFVNYFGFISNIKKINSICYDLGVITIEDNCHSYLSNNAFTNSICSDLSIFSLRKSLSINDGGALKFHARNSNKFLTDKNNFKKTKFSYLFKNNINFILIKFLEYTLSKIGIFNLYSDRFTRLKNKSRQPKNIASIDHPRLIKPSFLLQKYTKNHAYKKNTSEKIIENFNYLNENTTTLLKPLKRNIPRGTIPQYAIFYDKTGTLCNFLRKNRIGASKWPDTELPLFIKNNIKKFPISNKFNNCLLMIPIHQDISKKQIKRILDIIKIWMSQNK